MTHEIWALEEKNNSFHLVVDIEIIFAALPKHWEDHSQHLPHSFTQILCQDPCPPDGRQFTNLLRDQKT